MAEWEPPLAKEVETYRACTRAAADTGHRERCMHVAGDRAKHSVEVRLLRYSNDLSWHEPRKSSAPRIRVPQSTACGSLTGCDRLRKLQADVTPQIGQEWFFEGRSRAKGEPPRTGRTPGPLGGHCLSGNEPLPRRKIHSTSHTIASTRRSARAQLSP